MKSFDPEADPRNFIDMCLKRRLDLGGDDSELSLDVIYDLCFGDILAAGGDTLATFILWILTYLANNPDYQTRIYEEMKLKLGDRVPGPRDEGLLLLLQACILETARLRPAGPLSLPRENIRPIIVCGWTIPARTIFMSNAYACGLDESIWTDPTRWNPDRFLNPTEEMKSTKSIRSDFGYGLRACPGLFQIMPSHWHECCKSS